MPFHIRQVLTMYLISTFVLYTSPLPYAYANPQGGVVGAGSANIVESGKNLSVNQTSDKAVIDWRSFNIEVDESTRFNQPSSSSTTLNRVNDMNPSHIFGGLSANGNVMLLNPNGVMFGPNSRVDVNGLLATTANISNENFMNGHMVFDSTGSNPNGSIINEGIITAAEAGLVGLVAPNVRNHGIINARLGKVHLASGDSFTLDMYGDGLVAIGISDDVHSQVVSNTGVINAEGGVIKMTAAAGREMVNSLIEVGGELHAPAVAEKNGQIYIYAEGSNAVEGNVEANKGVKSGESTVLVSGELDASGYNAGEKGGKIEVLGDRVGVLSGAKIDASGDAGGGEILLGGDYQGKGATPNATTTIVQKDAEIKADAVTSGNGGKVIEWSDEYTDFSGDISVKGGANSGDGGFVETSSHGILKAEGTIEASSEHGKGGTWLLDPRDVTISTATETMPAGVTASGTDTFTPTTDSTIINPSTITGQLSSGVNVVITTGSTGSQTGNITVSNAIQKTGANTATLTLNAAGSIIVNADIKTDGASNNLLNLILNADYDDSHSGNIQVASSTIDTNGGYLKMVGGSTASGYAYGTGVATATGAGIYLSSATVSTGAGAITMNGNGNATAGATANVRLGVLVSSSSISSTTGQIDITGVGGPGSSGSYGVSVASGTITTTSGVMNITGTGGVNPASISNSLYASNYGISLSGTGAISSTGSGSAGDVNIIGYGANGYGGDYGVRIGPSATISTKNANFTITGRGGDDASAAGGGIYSFGAMSVTGSGNLTLVASARSGATHTSTSLAGDIQTTSGANITKTGATTSLLTMQADGSIILNSSISTDGSTSNVLNVILNADHDDSHSGNIQVATSTIDTNGGYLKMVGGSTASGYAYGTGISSQAFKSGIYIYTSTVSTGAGAITMMGYGYNVANASNTVSGVYMGASTVSSTSGRIDVTGIGGLGKNGNYGVTITNGATSPVFTTTSGVMNITGTGGVDPANTSTSGYTDNYGVFIGGVATVGSTGSGSGNGDVTITGYGANGYGLDWGVRIGNNSTVTTKNANMYMYGHGGDDTTTAGAGIMNLGIISATGTGNLYLSASAKDGATHTSTSLASDVQSSGNDSIQTSGGTITIVTASDGHFVNDGSTFKTAGGAIAINSAITISGNLTIDTTNSGASTTGANITLGSTVDGAYNLVLKSGTSGSTTLNGIVGGSTAISTMTVTSGGGVNFNKSVTANNITADTTSGTGNITIASSAVLTEQNSSGNRLVLATSGNFVNNSGSGALVTTGTSRWLVYSASPLTNTLGDLASDNHVYNKTYSGYAPASVTQSGNVLLYAYAPTLTVTANSATKTYGDANPTLTATITGFLSGDTAASSYSGSAKLTTLATSLSNAGSYTITSAVGTLLSSMGYLFTYVNNTLTVSPAALTVTAASTSKISGNDNPTFAYSYSSLKNSDTSSVFTGSLTSPANSSSLAGSYNINIGTLSAGSNYTISYISGILTVISSTVTSLLTPPPPTPTKPSNSLNATTNSSASDTSISSVTSSLIKFNASDFQSNIGSISTIVTNAVDAITSDKNNAPLNNSILYNKPSILIEKNNKNNNPAQEPTADNITE